MGYLLSHTLDFTGAASVRGANIDGYSQTEVFNAPYLRTDGAGKVIADAPSSFNCYLHGAADITANKYAAEIDFVWDNTNNFIMEVLGRFLNSHITGGFYKGYRVWLRAFGGETAQLMIRIGAANGNGADIAITNGVAYTLRIEIEEGSPNNTIIGRLYAQSAPTVQLGSVTSADNTADYAGSTGRAVGFSCNGSDYVTANWAVTALRVYNWDYGDVTPPTISSAALLSSGTILKLTASEAILTTTKGLLELFTVDTDSDTPIDVVAASLSSPYIVLGLNRRVAGGGAAETLTVDYDGGSGDITDASANLNPLAAFSGRAVINNSTQTSIAASTHGVQLLGTRGCVGGYTNGTDAGMEAMGAYRVDQPNGADAGWRVRYGGPILENKTIEVPGCLVEIVQPSHPPLRMWVTFSSGNPDLQAGQNAFVDSDGIPIGTLRGSYVRVLQRHRYLSPTEVGLPTNSHGGYGWTGAQPDPSLTVMDGLVIGARGDFTNDDLWDWDGIGNAGSAGLSGIERMYRPWIVYGKPHPDYDGTNEPVAGGGDSQLIGEDDWDGTGVYPVSGWFGRMFGKDRPWVTLGFSGGSAGTFIALAGEQWFTDIMGSADRDTPRMVGYFVDEFGINPLRTGSSSDQVWADRLSVAAIVTARGSYYLQTLLTPVEDGHGWITGTYTTFVTRRATFQTRVRTQTLSIPGAIGYLNWGTAVEPDAASNGNTYTLTQDGLHQSGAGHIACADGARAGTLALFTANPNPIPTWITITTDQLPATTDVRDLTPFGQSMLETGTLNVFLEGDPQLKEPFPSGGGSTTLTISDDDGETFEATPNKLADHFAATVDADAGNDCDLNVEIIGYGTDNGVEDTLLSATAQGINPPPVAAGTKRTFHVDLSRDPRRFSKFIVHVWPAVAGGTGSADVQAAC